MNRTNKLTFLTNFKAKNLVVAKICITFAFENVIMLKN